MVAIHCAVMWAGIITDQPLREPNSLVCVSIGNRPWGGLFGGFTMFAPKPLNDIEDQRSGENVIHSVVSDLVTIAERLANMGSIRTGQFVASSAPSLISADQAYLVALAEEELRRRKLRARFLPAQFFWRSSLVDASRSLRLRIPEPTRRDHQCMHCCRGTRFNCVALARSSGAALLDRTL